jgi:predicted short-subunit dehydrogenase-like oxidoreductase (DUF2520 family)
MRVVLVGPGRLGRSLHILLQRAGHEVRLLSRGDTWPGGDVGWLTVPDRAIEEAAVVVPREVPALHASGASDLRPLAHHVERGSLHPLMTFPGPEVALPDLRGVAAAIDGTPRAAALARELAVDLGLAPFAVPGDRRLYHAAAVMAGNFATLFLAEASRVLAAAGVPLADAPAILAPLALRSLHNAEAAPGGPLTALTGPIPRGDRAVLDAHRAALTEAGLADLAALHRAVTEHGLSLLASNRTFRDATPNASREDDSGPLSIAVGASKKGS